MTIYTFSQASELAKSHGSEFSNGAWVLLSLANIHSPYLSNSDKVAELENLLFFAQRCIGAGCEPRVRPLPGQDSQGVSLAAPADADRVEGTPYQQHEAHARAVRQGHDGRTSRGLSVEIARFALDNPIFGDDPAELLADLQRCAADCIGAGCEPLFAPPGQSKAGSFAAPAQAAQVERPRYCLNLFKRPVGIWGHFHSINSVSFFRLCTVITVQGIKSSERR